MAESAYMGQQPVTAKDELIAAALKATSPSLYNIDPAYPLGIPKPYPNAPNEYNGDRVFRLATACLISVVIITTGRLSLRRFQNKLSFGLDDWVVVPAALTAVAYCSNGYVLLDGGCVGRHVYYCTYENYNYMIEIIAVDQSIFYFGVYCAKISIILFNRRLTALTSRRWAITHWVYMAVIISCMLTSVFSVIFTCTPARSHYNLIYLALAAENHSLHCLNENKLQEALRALHIATDLALLAIPLLVLHQLQLPLRKKIQMGLLFSVGVMTCISSIMRNVVAGDAPLDFPYDSFALLAWDTIDISFAVIVASLPVYAALLDRLVTSTYRFVSEASYYSDSKFKRGRILSRSSNCERLDDYDGGKTCANQDAKSSRELGKIYRTDEFELRSVVGETIPHQCEVGTNVAITP